MMGCARWAAVFLLLSVAIRAGATAPEGAGYQVQNRSIVSSGSNRGFVQATPVSGTLGKPLVLVLHGDGGSGAGIRAALPLEAAAAGAALFVYPDAPGGTFPYFTAIGRTREMQFVRDVIDLLAAEAQIDRSRVFLAGFSGGGTMANVLACRLGAGEIRGAAVNAGSLYPIEDDFTYTGNGGVSCNLPAMLLLWGESDNTPGVSYATGVSVRNNVTATQGCSAASTGFAPAPCIRYQQCQRDVGWCSIPGLGHSLWSQSALASWNFFSALGGPPPAAGSLLLYDDNLQNGWQDFSWGTVDFAHTGNVHSGTRSVRFDAHSFQGLSFARPAAPVSTAQFPELRFQIRGTAGGENLRLSLQSGGTLHANVPLAPLVSGGGIAAGAYREVRVRLDQPPISYSGSFERINLQDDAGATAANPQTVYVDQVELLPASQLHADGFE